MILKILVGGAVVAGALVVGSGVASAAVPSTGAVTAVAGCSASAGLYWDPPGTATNIYARKTGGCATIPSTVTAYLFRNGVEVARATCYAPAGGRCTTATRTVKFGPASWRAA